MTNPVATIRHVNDHGDLYDAIMLWCPGCATERHGLNMLPVTGNGEARPTWGWNGNLEVVTLSPSILTRSTYSIPGPREFVCHSFLREGIWEFLGDCTHEFANQKVPMLALPDWVVGEVKEDGPE